jgi:hypothetical protein
MNQTKPSMIGKSVIDGWMQAVASMKNPLREMFKQLFRKS